MIESILWEGRVPRYSNSQRLAPLAPKGYILRMADKSTQQTPYFHTSQASKSHMLDSFQLPYAMVTLPHLASQQTICS